MQALTDSLCATEAAMPLSSAIGASTLRLAKALQLVAWAGLRADAQRHRALIDAVPDLQPHLDGLLDALPGPLASLADLDAAAPPAPDGAPSWAAEARRLVLEAHSDAGKRSLRMGALLGDVWTQLEPLWSSLGSCLSAVASGLKREAEGVRIEVTAASQVLPRGAPQVQPVVEALFVLASTVMGLLGSGAEAGGSRRGTQIGGEARAEAAPFLDANGAPFAHHPSDTVGGGRKACLDAWSRGYLDGSHPCVHSTSPGPWSSAVLPSPPIPLPRPRPLAFSSRSRRHRRASSKSAGMGPLAGAHRRRH